MYVLSIFARDVSNIHTINMVRKGSTTLNRNNATPPLFFNHYNTIFLSLLIFFFLFSLCTEGARGVECHLFQAFKCHEFMIYNELHKDEHLGPSTAEASNTQAIPEPGRPLPSTRSIHIYRAKANGNTLLLLFVFFR